MFFEFGRIICGLASGLNGIIAWKLLRQGRENSFINQLLALHFIFNTVATSIYLHLFFEIGSAFLLMQDELTKDDTAALCMYYIRSFSGLYTVGSLPSLGIIFCRFIYARYAHGLVADQGRLFHKIVLLVIIIFTLHSLMLDSQYDYRTRIKGRICNQIEFPDKSNKDFHVKPKLLITIGVILYMTAITFFQHTASRQKKRYNIPKRRQNLMTIKQHTFYNHLIGICLLFDQLILNTFIQVFHTSLGAHTVLEIWWVWHLLMFTLIHILAPLYIYYCATSQYPEFSGLKGRQYPGQQTPRRQVLIPRRENCMKKPELKESVTETRCRKKGGSKTNTIFITVLPRIREEQSEAETVKLDFGLV